MLNRATQGSLLSSFVSFALSISFTLSLSLGLSLNVAASSALAQTNTASHIDFAEFNFPFVPDPEMTTGSVCTPDNRDFERYRYEEQIAYCKRNVSRAIKQEIYRAYGVSSHCQKDYTIDHLIPLSIGGTNGIDNLWPEHKSIKALRKDLELDLYKKISQSQITQEEAIRIIRNAKWAPPISRPEKFKFCL